MRPSVVHLDLSAELAVPNRCPACGSNALTAVPIDDRTGFQCERCDTNWYVCFGVAQPVRDAAAAADRRPT